MKVQELLTTLNGLSDEQKQQEVSGRFLWRINRWLKLKLF